MSNNYIFVLFVTSAARDAHDGLKLRARTAYFKALKLKAPFLI